MVNISWEIITQKDPTVQFKSGACLILWLMVGNFFGDQAAGVLHIQMKYKYKRVIFFFLILEMVTFATSPPIKCILADLW